MMRAVVLILGILFVASVSHSADVDLRWDPSSGATGYKVQRSLDLGVTWLAAVDVGNVTQKVITGVEENVVVLFRVSAYNAAGESIRFWSGAWIDFRKKPISSPSGTGVY